MSVSCLALACLLAACATRQFQPPLGNATPPQASKAYLYGSFQLDGIDDIHAATNNYPAIGLRFLCDGDVEFTIGLAPRQPDQIVEVPAQRCSLKTITGNDAMSGKTIFETRYRGTALQDIAFAAGSMHYIGDLSGEYDRSPAAHLNGRSWRLKDHANRFHATSTRVIAAAPKLAGLPRLDVSGLPLEPVAAVRR